MKAATVSHHEAEVEKLREDRELAFEYLKAAMESLDDPDDRAAGLLALRAVGEAYGGLGAVAAEAGINRESLYRALSPKGNPTLKTLLAVLKIVGMRLSVEPATARPVRERKRRNLLGPSISPAVSTGKTCLWRFFRPFRFPF